MQLLSYDMCSHLLSPITESSSTIFVSAVHTENIEMGQERLKTMGDNKIVTVKVVAVAYQRWSLTIGRGTQREYSSKPLKHRIVKRILVFKL